MTDFQLRVLRHTLEGVCTANEAALLQHIDHLEALLQDALKEGGHIDVNSTPIGELRAENLQLREENSRLAERVVELQTRHRFPPPRPPRSINTVQNTSVSVMFDPSFESLPRDSGAFVQQEELERRRVAELNRHLDWLSWMNNTTINTEAR